MLDRAPLVLTRLRHPVLFVGALLALWFLGESALYRSGLYYWLAEPESNPGAVQNALLRLDRSCTGSTRRVLVLGDSRIGEGFSPTLAQADGDLTFIDYHVPGSTPRTWYYLLREALRRGCRVDAVLIGTLYAPRTPTRMADWPLDPSHQAPLTRLSDLADYPAAPASTAMRERAWRTLLIPSLIMQEDTRQLLGAPWQRVHRLRVYRPGYLAATASYAGRDEAMPAISLDADGNVLDIADASDWQRALIAGHVDELRTPIAADVAAANAEYVGHWLRAIATLARQHGARTVVFPLPRGPYRALLEEESGTQPVEAALAGLAGTVVLPRDLFHDLEDPAMFFDVLHANRAGREIISVRLGERLRALLREPA